MLTKILERYRQGGTGRRRLSTMGTGRRSLHTIQMARIEVV